MIDENTSDADTPVDGTVSRASKVQRKKSPKVRAAIAGPDSDNTVDQSRAPVKRRRFSDEERSAIVAGIEADLAGGATLRAAAKRAGVTEQSYYQWKKTEKQPSSSDAAEASEELSFEELDALESENQSLRNRLANKLRLENEELRKRLKAV